MALSDALPGKIPTPSAAAKQDQQGIRQYQKYLMELNQRRNDLFAKFTGNPQAQTEVEQWHKSMMVKLHQRFMPQQPNPIADLSGRVGRETVRPVTNRITTSPLTGYRTNVATQPTTRQTGYKGRRFDAFPNAKPQPTSPQYARVPTGITSRVNRSPAAQRSLPSVQPNLSRGRSQFNYRY